MTVMRRRSDRCVRATAVGIAALAVSAILAADTVPVRHTEGIVHGFLVLRTLEGATIANGDLIQLARGTRVTSRLRFQFTDGSLHDETTVFAQRGRFQFVSDHLIQRGPSFPTPLEMQLDASGAVRVHYTDEDGEQKEERDRLDLPSDVANGLVPVLLKNVDPKAPPRSFSFVAATPKPRLVKLMISSAGEERFTTGSEARTATHYVLKVDIGGLTGVLAGLFGKQPPDSHVWILGGDAPAFIRADQPLYTGGPLWRIELTAPVWRSRN